MTTREKLRSGTSLAFDPAAPESDRLIEAAWIEEAVDQRVPVDLEHAVVHGQLNLRYRFIEREFRVARCTLQDSADFSYTTFQRVADFSGSVFVAAPSFQCAVFQFDVRLEDVHFLNGNVRWSRATVQQRFLADRVTFGAAASASFDGWTCSDSATFAASAFGGAADFRRVQVRGSAMFSGAVFSASVTFENAKIEGDLVCGVPPQGGVRGADFAASAHFTGISVGRRTIFRGATFHGEASFVWARLDGAASFGLDADDRNAVYFCGEADFRDAVLTADADFEGVGFYGDAKFSSVRFGGTAFFKATEFRGAAEFDGVEASELNFEKACFRSTETQAVFEKAVVKGSAFFSECRFEGEVSLEGMKIEGAVGQFRKTSFGKHVSFAVADFQGVGEFHEAHFLEHSLPCFDGTHFSRSCSFDQAVFDDILQCRGARFDDQASFQGVIFVLGADFSVSEFAGIARFERKGAVDNEHPAIPAAQFRGDVCFEHARFDRDARFDDTIFRANAILRETAFHVVYFAADGNCGAQRQFQGFLDLTGCTYERIRADCQSLLTALHSYENRPGASYNRQPYAQLEKVYRSVGQDSAADDIYLERRRVEGRRLKLFHEPVASLLDSAYWVLANYGVRPRQLMVYAIVGIVLGSVAFRLPGSVQAKTDSKSGVPAVDCPISNEQSLGLSDSLRLAFRYFLPVDISILPTCEASIKRHWGLRFQDWAALIHVLGWILVPIGIASLTGILRRVAP